MDISETLLHAQNPDPNIRNPAEQVLKTAEEQQLPQLLWHLAAELNNEGKPETGRQLAGLYLKNTISAKDPAIREVKKQRWLTQVDATTRAQIKQMVLEALRSPNHRAGSSAAQVVGTIGAVELPIQQWPELLQTLLQNVFQATEDGMRISTLQALGYICEDLSLEMNPQQEVPQRETDIILTAIVEGIRKERGPEVRLAAATALCNSLEFCRRNMENEGERNMIMQVICEATQCEDQRVKKKAYECIAAVASLYYDKLQPYMSALFDLTLGCIKEGTSDAAFQAVEFWNTLCEEEMDILEEIREYQEYAASGEVEQPPRQCFYYVQTALEHLVPLLIETLTKQEEHTDPDTWNIAMAGGTCLTLVAQTVEDKVLEWSVDFVVKNISHPDWRMREAATMAFGSILDGPSSESLRTLVAGSIPYLLKGLQDPHPLVKDTSCWTLGKIFELHWTCVPSDMLPTVVQSLLQSLDDPSPVVAEKACFAIYNLASDRVAQDYPSASPSTNYLSHFMAHLMDKLLQSTERADAGDCNLRAAAYEAVNMLITNAAPDCYGLLGDHVMPLLLMRLQQTFAMSDLTMDAKEELWNLQSLLCGTLMTCTQKLERNIAPFADKVMELYIGVFRRHRHATAHEEALMAVGALADKLERQFIKYMPHFEEYLHAALRNFEDVQVCTVAIGVVGDLCRAMDKQLAPFCAPIIEIFLQNLRNQEVHRSIKPHILACFGDVAFQIGGEFERFLHHTMTILGQAAMTTTTYNADDDDLVEHINHLRESILDAYTGIVQGLAADQKQSLLMQPAYLQPLVALLMAISSDQHSEEPVIKRSIGLVGDLASHLREKVAAAIGLHNPWVQNLFKNVDSYSDDTRKVATYTKSVLERLPR